MRGSAHLLMTSSKRIVLLSLCLLALPLGACQSRPPLPPPAGPRGTEALRAESFVGPFETQHPYRGPGLVLVGVPLVGEQGSFVVSIDAFARGRDVVFYAFKARETPADWLEECPVVPETPPKRRFRVMLQGVGDVSANAMSEGETDDWSTSIEGSSYVRLQTLRFEVCGRVYALPKAHEERLALHQRMVGEDLSKRLSEEGARPRACGTGDGAACVAWGGELADPAQKRQAYERACTLGALEGCSRLAEMLYQGHGGQKEPARAWRLLKESCEKGHGGACLGASRAVISRPSAQPTPDAEPRYAQGAVLARRACELGGTTTAVSCLWAAELHATGFGVPASAALVASFADKSCAEDFETACQRRAPLVSCAAGKGDDCALLAEAQRRRRHRLLQDDGSEAVWRVAACRKGHAASCPLAPR